MGFTYPIKKGMKNELTIRFSKTEDLPFIVNIYNQAIRSGNATGDINEFDVANRIDWFSKYDNNEYPLYVAEIANRVIGYCTISPYRSGRQAMLKVAEISYYVDYYYHRKGIGTALINHAIADCKRIKKESLLAILLDINTQSIGILEKFKFEKWGYFPDIINLHGIRCSQLIYGLKTKKQ